MTEFSAIHIEQINQARQRLDLHDTRLTKLETHSAVAAERAEHIQKSLDKLESGQSWLIRLVIGAIVLGAIGFMMSGGFHVGK